MAPYWQGDAISGREVVRHLGTYTIVDGPTRTQRESKSTDRVSTGLTLFANTSVLSSTTGTTGGNVFPFRRHST